MANTSHIESLKMQIVSLNIIQIHSISEMEYVTYLIKHDNDDTEYPGNMLVPMDFINMTKMEPGDEFHMVLQKTKSVNHKATPKKHAT